MLSNKDKKKYLKHKIRTRFLESCLGISQKQANQIADDYYLQFQKLPEKVQNEMLYSDELLLKLTNIHILSLET